MSKLLKSEYQSCLEGLVCQSCACNTRCHTIERVVVRNSHPVNLKLAMVYFPSKISIHPTLIFRFCPVFSGVILKV